METKQRYSEKLVSMGMEKCSYKLKADEWIENPRKWPGMEYGHLYNYLIKSPSKLQFHYI